MDVNDEICDDLPARPEDLGNPLEPMWCSNADSKLEAEQRVQWHRLQVHCMKENLAKRTN